MTERFFARPLIEGQPVELDPSESHHLQHVMRGRVGDRVTLFDGQGAEAPASVASITRRSVVLQVGPVAHVSREAVQRMTLGVAPPRGHRDRFLVEKAVELGVDRLVWLETSRGVVRFRPSAIEKHGRAVIEASKQCGRNQLMTVEAMPLSSYLETVDAPVRWMAHTTPPATMHQDVPSDARSIALAVGPEGGFTDEEVSAARQLGWQLVSLGPRTLRIETAALALCAKIVLS